ncbi:uncharacterized protein LOC100679284 isoform X1 [Nasonia vitripennis]|uniref:Uncharacterized protein n=1 Tax=Nasonia vitripennis TaxID=7425 RepID=A0A7M7QIY5_NASVI|nr:uncharacterized protein LOC100679284 isoform X1 [Nasonia vitripennis]XP_031788367.1 uncharacterized protein LOC100679284 isoform X1 [Nasonia vitripennis]
MQILRASILLMALLSERVSRTTTTTAFPGDSAKLRHLSGKLNPAECPRPRGCSPVTGVNCLRRLAHWRDKLPATYRNPRDNAKSATLRRTKREAKLPAHFLLRLHEPAAAVANRRDSRSSARRKARRHPKSRRRRKRISPTISNSDPPGDSRRGSPQVVLIVLCSLAAITASALLLFYLRRRSRQSSQQQQPLLDSFFCPPENEKSRDNLGEIDRCTCCSSSRGDQSAAATSAKSAVAPRRKTRKKRKRNKTDVSRHYIENEELRSRIACILRDQCNLRCDCCKCDNVQQLDRGQPKRGRFKFFRKSKDKKTCNDARCDENKISCLVDLCGNQPRDNDDDSKAIRGKPGLRIKE